MTRHRSEFLNAIVDRGFVHQCTDMEALDALAADSAPITAYIGFDATADSLHVGNLIAIMLLRWLQRTGHKPIVLMGGGTTKIGDPSFRDETRRLLDVQDIERNIAGIKGVFEKFLTFGEGPTDAIMVNNADWLDELNYIEFLRDYGRHFSVNRMLSFDSVKLRMDRQQSLSFLEFNYMILQAYDFLELSRRQSCQVQMGGSDQWGNIVNGVELGRRVDGAGLFGLTTPLLETALGVKMGKTAEGAVWLNEERLSAYDYWQFWRNTEDADVGRFLRLYSELPLEEIARVDALEGAELNEAKKILASEVTALCHGRDAAGAAAETAEQTFERGGIGKELPTMEIARSELESGIAAFELLHRVGLAQSKGEARKLIRAGGGRLNDQVMTDEHLMVTADALSETGVIKLSAGRKRHILILPV